jgi:shikimate dehydrogenase
MAAILSINEIHRHISNRLDASAITGKSVAGIIGDSPSRYSKSPPLWNAAFRHLGMSATYLPFDVDDAQLGDLLRVLRDSEQVLGVNVTVPHKLRVMEFLDDLDPGAGRIQAVNTVVRSADGKLTGYNTDGEGFIDSLLLPTPEHRKGFMPSLDGIDVLLLGAGGSARAVAFHVSDHVGDGQLIIANRTLAHAQSLAGEIAQLGRHAIAIHEEDVSIWAPKVGLIVNSTTKGQGGVRNAEPGRVTMLEPYSALAPATPPTLPDNLGARFSGQWEIVAKGGIEDNIRRSANLAAAIPAATRFYDLIYHPEETVFLRHGRETGHRTMNGKTMIVCQAVIAFCRRVCRRQLQALGKDRSETQREVAEVMFASWSV